MRDERLPTKRAERMEKLDRSLSVCLEAGLNLGCMFVGVDLEQDAVVTTEARQLLDHLAGIGLHCPAGERGRDVGVATAVRDMSLGGGQGGIDGRRRVWRHGAGREILEIVCTRRRD